MKRFLPFVAFCAVFALAIAPVVSSSANAQRRIIGAGDEPTDAGPPREWTITEKRIER